MALIELFTGLLAFLSVGTVLHSILSASCKFRRINFNMKYRLDKWFVSDELLSLSSFRALLSLVLPLLIVVRAIRKRSLTRSGAFAGIRASPCFSLLHTVFHTVCLNVCIAWFIGFALILCSYTYMCMMLCFFWTSSRLSRYRSEKKVKTLNEGLGTVYRSLIRICVNMNLECLKRTKGIGIGSRWWQMGAFRRCWV